MKTVQLRNQVNRVSRVDSTSLLGAYPGVLSDTPTECVTQCANIPSLKHTPDTMQTMQTMHQAGRVPKNTVHKTVQGMSLLKTSSSEKFPADAYLQTFLAHAHVQTCHSSQANPSCMWPHPFYKEGDGAHEIMFAPPRQYQMSSVTISSLSFSTLLLWPPFFPEVIPTYGILRYCCTR